MKKIAVLGIVFFLMFSSFALGHVVAMRSFAASEFSGIPLSVFDAGDVSLRATFPSPQPKGFRLTVYDLSGRDSADGMPVEGYQQVDGASLLPDLYKKLTPFYALPEKIMAKIERTDHKVTAAIIHDNMLFYYTNTF